VYHERYAIQEDQHGQKTWTRKSLAPVENGRPAGVLGTWGGTIFPPLIPAVEMQYF
jgi:hypothetical protein